jgi:APA family basic amino acid/polyamine antiporter
MSLRNRLFATKSLELIHDEMSEDEGRLRRALGPVGLTALGIGAIIGAGIFVMGGREAANDAGPAIVLSFAVAGLGCALAAFCYAEFAAMAPVAGSAYTYAYATLGEILAWIIGWDLILEYAMSCSVVGAVWSHYLNEFLLSLFHWQIPDWLCTDPFTSTVPGAIMNLPGAFVILAATVILVIGIRESAMSNTFLVLIKLSVVLFVIGMGVRYIVPSNFTEISVAERKLPAELAIPKATSDFVAEEYKDLPKPEREARNRTLLEQATATYHVKRAAAIRDQLRAEGKLTDGTRQRLGASEAHYRPLLPDDSAADVQIDKILGMAEVAGEKADADKWGLLGLLGLRSVLMNADDAVRSPFMPYGISGLMLAAAMVFFAFIGFDAISTHAEEAVRPQRDLPIAIIGSLVLCTVLYILMATVIVGMKPYPTIDTSAAVASAFREQGEATGNSALRAAAGLIASGALAGMTSVILITFLSQARVFLAMARDGLLPREIFAAVHPRFKTPHVSTITIGMSSAAIAAFTPVDKLEDMVNIGTLFAFVVVCAAVLILRIKRPDARRPFRCPAVYLVAPLGILVNALMMLFLSPWTWLRLLVWLVIGLVIYITYGYRHSRLSLRSQPNGAISD